MSSTVQPKITAYIIAFNEAQKIAAAVNSVLWADEIIVADSGSTDGMVEIAESLGARVVQVPFKGFGDLRNNAIAACTHDWIFSLDADERCTPEARDEILRVIADPASLDMYWMPRRNFFMGRWIKHSGWHPNYRQPQLFRKGKMSYTMEPVHEGYVPHSERPVGHLQNPIWQVPFKNLHEVVHKANRYSTLGAEKLTLRGRKGSMGKALTPAPFLLPRPPGQPDEARPQPPHYPRTRTRLLVRARRHHRRQRRRPHRCRQRHLHRCRKRCPD